MHVVYKTCLSSFPATLFKHVAVLLCASWDRVPPIQALIIFSFCLFQATLVKYTTDEFDQRILYEYLAEASVVFPKVFPVV